MSALMAIFPIRFFAPGGATSQSAVTNAQERFIAACVKLRRRISCAGILVLFDCWVGPTGAVEVEAENPALVSK